MQFKAKLVQKHKGTLRFETREEGKLSKQTGMIDISVSDENFNSFSEGETYEVSIDKTVEKEEEEN